MNPTEAAADMPTSFLWVGGKWVNDENGTWQPDCPSGDILARPEDRGEASFSEMSNFSCPINAQKMVDLLHIMH